MEWLLLHRIYNSMKIQVIDHDFVMATVSHNILPNMNAWYFGWSSDLECLDVFRLSFHSIWSNRNNWLQLILLEIPKHVEWDELKTDTIVSPAYLVPCLAKTSTNKLIDVSLSHYHSHLPCRVDEYKYEYEYYRWLSQVLLSIVPTVVPLRIKS
jgi:hypothetical protein